MDDLEVAGSVNNHSCNLANVAGTGVRGRIAHNSVTALEKLLRNILGLVLSQAFEQARQE